MMAIMSTNSIPAAVVPDAGGNESLPVQSGGLFAKHWRGNYSLPRSYWVNGALIFGLCVNMPLMILIVAAMFLFKKQPALLVIVCLGEMLLILSAYIWALVGTWRAARKYRGPRIWAMLAQFFMVIGVFVSITHVIQDVNIISQVASGSAQADDVRLGR